MIIDFLSWAQAVAQAQVIQEKAVETPHGTFLVLIQGKIEVEDKEIKYGSNYTGSKYEFNISLDEYPDQANDYSGNRYKHITEEKYDLSPINLESVLSRLIRDSKLLKYQNDPKLVTRFVQEAIQDSHDPRIGSSLQDSTSEGHYWDGTFQIGFYGEDQYNRTNLTFRKYAYGQEIEENPDENEAIDKKP